jgi:leucyl-tRNA---protein transferase
MKLQQEIQYSMDTPQGLEQLETLLHLGDFTEACPYLEKCVSTLHFVDGFAGGPFYRWLLDRGYRRNGGYFYRPVCAHCQECQVIRVPVAEFRKSKEQRRIWNRGQRVFEVSLCAPECTREKLAVYERYLVHQHGEAKDAAIEHYQAFLVDTCLGGMTVEVQLRVEDRLAGVGILDCMADALSTVYFYFDPDFARFSPGTYSALYEIDLAQRWGLRYYYLGYYVQACRQMNYKARFRPCEIKRPHESQWRRLERNLDSRT